jgi:hypothetical protein
MILRPDHTQLALALLSALCIAERIWLFVARIITFFDRRANSRRKSEALVKRAEVALSLTPVDLPPAAAGGALPTVRATPVRHRRAAKRLLHAPVNKLNGGTIAAEVLS